MASQESVKLFDEVVNAWRLEIDLKKVIKEEYGTLSLGELRVSFDKFQEDLNGIEKFKKDIPTDNLNKIITSVRSIVDICRTLANLNQEEFSRSRNGLRDNLLQRFEEFEVYRTSILPIFLEKVYLGSGDYLKKSQEEASKMSELRSNQEKEFAEFRKRFKDVFDGTTIASERNRFTLTAAVNKRQANVWLVFVILSSIILLTWLWFIMSNFCFDSSCYNIDLLNSYSKVCDSCGADMLHFEMAKSLLFRLFVVSFLVFLVTLCVRNNNSNMHNHTVNLHKGNSLDAALYLLNKASQNANDLIVSQASNAIFSHQPTGFSRKDPENGELGLVERLSEFLRNK